MQRPTTLHENLLIPRRLSFRRFAIQHRQFAAEQHEHIKRIEQNVVGTDLVQGSENRGLRSIASSAESLQAHRVAVPSVWGNSPNWKFKRRIIRAWSACDLLTDWI